MTKDEKEAILIKAKFWFKSSIAENHIKNRKKLKSAQKFDINPFLSHVFSQFFNGRFFA